MDVAYYPEIEPFDHFYLEISKEHHIYVEQCGNPQGIPVVFVHGGPGSGCSQRDRRFFNPETYRVILFDQRGAGRSKPLASVENNNTQLLIEDIESIRNKLQIESWIVFGGSWGSTLSLCYAETYPARTSALIVRGVFLGTSAELSYLYQSGMSAFYPEEFQTFSGHISYEKRQNITQAYYELLQHKNLDTRLNAAHRWLDWESAGISLLPQSMLDKTAAEPEVVISQALIECHYFVNQCFLEPNQLLNNANKLKNLPVHIVQGRYDMLCPPEAAWRLHQALPQSKLHIVQAAGHIAHEPHIASKLIEILDNLTL